MRWPSHCNPPCAASCRGPTRPCGTRYSRGARQAMRAGRSCCWSRCSRWRCASPSPACTPAPPSPSPTPLATSPHSTVSRLPVPAPLRSCRPALSATLSAAGAGAGYGQAGSHQVLLAPTLHPDVRDPRGAGAGAAGAGDVGENRLLAWLGRGATELLQDLFLAPHGPALRARLAHGDCALGGAPGADAPAWRQALAALTALAAACSWAVAAPGSPSGSRSPGMRSGGVREEEEEGGWREAAAAAAAAGWRRTARASIRSACSRVTCARCAPRPAASTTLSSRPRPASLPRLV